MKALSIRQPWAWAILNAGKNIENRNWDTKFRGRFLIHASKGMTQAEYDDFVDFARAVRRQQKATDTLILPTHERLDRGGIVGMANLVTTIVESSSPWFMGNFGFVLSDVRAIPFIPYKGRLGFFDVPDDLIAEVRA